MWKGSSVYINKLLIYLYIDKKKLSFQRILGPYFKNIKLLNYEKKLKCILK